MDQKQAVRELAELGCIVEKNAVEALEDAHVDQIKALSPPPMVVNEQLVTNISRKLRQQEQTVDVVSEEDGSSDGPVDGLKESDETTPLRTSVDVETQIDQEKEKRTINDFVDYYNDRYERMKDLLLRRRDISSAVSMARLENMSEGDDASVVGIVNDKYKTNSGRFIVNVEDPTGQGKLLVDEEDGEQIVPDEVIGVNGQLGDDIIFADEVIWPDLPLATDISTTEDEVYAAFISDIHYGSIDTLNDAVDTFRTWLNNENAFTEKVKYLFVVGDMVEGVGTYPGQKEELEVENIHDQYQLFVDFVKELRDDIQVIIGPGNHDMVRLAEPQPPIPEEYCEELYAMDNVYMVPNPCYVNIHFHGENKGISVLMYHGYSFDGHVSSLQHLRDVAYENPDRAMVDFLKRRHLAPTYGSNLLVPDEYDHHVIDKTPDIFCMGHTHSFANTTYKGVNVVCAGTFQAQTDFQRRVGHEPDPGKVSIINLKTRESKVKVFWSGNDDADEEDESPEDVGSQEESVEEGDNNE